MQKPTNVDIEELLENLNNAWDPILSQLNSNLDRLDSLLGEKASFKFKPITKDEVDS